MSEKIEWTNADATLAFFDRHEELKAENKALKEIMDSVLKALITILELSPNKVHWPEIESIIERAEALKEKTKFQGEK